MDKVCVQRGKSANFIMISYSFKSSTFKHQPYPIKRSKQIKKYAKKD